MTTTAVFLMPSLLPSGDRGTWCYPFRSRCVFPVTTFAIGTIACSLTVPCRGGLLGGSREATSSASKACPFGVPATLFAVFGHSLTFSYDDDRSHFTTLMIKAIYQSSQIYSQQ